MGTSGPAQGQGIARRSRDGLRMGLPALAGCDRRGPALRRGDDPAATRRGTRPLTGTRPCQTAAKPRCCAGRRSGPRQHDAIAMAIRPWHRRVTHKRALINLDPSTLQVHAGCPVTWLPRFDQRFTAPHRGRVFRSHPAPLICVQWSMVDHAVPCISTAPSFVVSAQPAGSDNPAAVPRSCDRAR